LIHCIGLVQCLDFIHCLGLICAFY
jgi:hypothetical protein